MLRRFTKVLGIGVCFLTFLCGCVFFIFYMYGRNLPDYRFLIHYQSPSATRIYSRDLQLIKVFAKQNRIVLSIHKIPRLVQDAFLIAEDKNFYYHTGLDAGGMVRAFMSNLLHQRWKNGAIGASTITQQVAKNLLIGNEKSITRKIREAIMAFRLERMLTKDRILEIYLNEIYLGRGYYGVAAASLGYFGKPLGELSMAEIAYLASLPKAPSLYHPLRDKKKAILRRNWIIKRMEKAGLISSEEAHHALSKDLIVTKNPYPLHNVGEYYTQEIRQLLLQTYGAKAFSQGGLSVITTLDLSLQQNAERALKDGLMFYERRHGWRGPIKHINIENHTKEALLRELKKILPITKESWKTAVVMKITHEKAQILLENDATGEIFLKDTLWAKPFTYDARKGRAPQKMFDILQEGDVIYVKQLAPNTYALQQLPQVTGAIVVLDADTGEVLAMGGGFDIRLNQFNCATQARRQPGSAFKPFVYLAALEKGYTPQTKINDAPMHMSLGAGLGVYAPKNYTRIAYGPTSLGKGIIHSRNLMTVQLAKQIGMSSIQKLAASLEIMERMPRELAMALGAGETTLLRLCNAYASIINQGKKIKPVFIKTIYDAHAQVMERVSPFRLENGQWVDYRKQVISQKSAGIMADLLYEAVHMGTGKSLAYMRGQYNMIVGGKTGTTNNYKDAWFIGFVQVPHKHVPHKKTYIIGTFIGYPMPRSLGEDETGSRSAIPIFKNFIELAAEYLQKSS